CPPEDCGGPPGHHHLKTVMADPASPDFEEMVEWLGGPYDPNAFDARAVNRELCRWVLSQV
ncbi:MAG: plasmid pRiA4b ORF-3 family protein, partial [Myxococcota bacterium]